MKRKIFNSFMHKVMGRSKSKGYSKVFKYILFGLLSVTAHSFDAGEHAVIGDLAFSKYFPNYENNIKNLEADISFTYGHLIAMAGDMYKSVEEIALDEPSYIKDYLLHNRKKLKQCIDKEIRSIYESKNYEKCSETRLIKRKFRYLTLAHDNYSHFSWHNLVNYVEYHDQALWFAELAFNKCDNQALQKNADICKIKAQRLSDMIMASHYKKRLSKKYKYLKKVLSRKKITKKYLLQLDKQSLIHLALFANAFADHYLTDAFSAGHARIPRAQIDQYVEYNTSKPIDKNKRSEGSAISGALTQWLHNFDGELYGLKVKNLRGNKFTIRGDKQLFAKPGSIELQGEPDKNLVASIPIEAVGQSIGEVFSMIETGPQEHEALKTERPLFSALSLVPMIDYDNTSSLEALASQYVLSSGSAKEAMKKMSPEMINVFRSQFLFADENYEEYFSEFINNIGKLMESFQEQIKSDSHNTKVKKHIPTPLIYYFRTIR